MAGVVFAEVAAAGEEGSRGATWVGAAAGAVRKGNGDGVEAGGAGRVEG